MKKDFLAPACTEEKVAGTEDPMEEEDWMATGRLWCVKAGIEGEEKGRMEGGGRAMLVHPRTV